LRKRLDVEKAEFHVVKNSSLRVAAKALGLPDIDSSLTGPTAVVVGGKNSAGVAKILKKFFEDKQKLEVKVGVMDKKIITAADLSKIADLPSFGALRSQLLGVLGEQAEELRAQRPKRGQVRNLREVGGGDDLLVHHAHLHLELLFVLEEFLQDLRHAGGVLAAHDDGGGAGERAVDFGQAEGLGRDAQRAVLDDVE